MSITLKITTSVLCTLVFLAWGWFVTSLLFLGPKGRNNINKLNNSINSLRIENNKLKKDSIILQRQIDYFSNHHAAIQGYIRQSNNLIKKNEIFIILDNDN